MLYVSTRSKTDSFTAYRVLHETAAPDGGMYAPFRFPVLEDDQLQKMHTASFSENVALILNLFFSSELTAWDIDCCVGRSPCKMVPMNRRILIGEVWHNLGGSYQYFYSSISAKLTEPGTTPSPWLKIAVDVAVLFGLYAEAVRMGVEQLDVAVDADDFSAPLAVLYACKLGLPVKRVICCLKDNSNLWNFIHHGELSTVFQTPEHLELFLYSAFGYQEVGRYLDACSRKGMYVLSERKVKAMGRLLSPVVVGQERISDIIRNVYYTNSCILDTSAALAYGGLQDFRAGTGESCDTLILSAVNPAKQGNVITGAIGVDADTLFR